MKLLTFIFLLSTGLVLRAAERMNVLLVFVDDLGQTDLGCYGSKFYETPHLDKLAQDSVKFTQAYSACTVCSPTRASLLTGKYPARLHLTDWIPGHNRPKAKLLPPKDWQQQLPLQEVTLAEILKSEGYATASIGKWHLGETAFFPTMQGFDLNLGGTHKGQPPSFISPYGIPTMPDGPAGEFLTDREAAEAIRFIEKQGTNPWFVYLPLHAVHTPLMGKPEVVAKYKSKASKANQAQGKPPYAALVESVDDLIGSLRKKLEALGQWEKTIVIFTSDNGGLAANGVTQNLNLRSGKGSEYEGGTRVPLIIRVPGLTKAGTQCEVPVITPDLFTTIIKLVAPTTQQLPAGVDGIDLKGLLEGGKQLPRESIYWHYPHYHPGGATPYSAIRSGHHKLIHYYEDGRQELYDLASDPEEKSNLAAAKPDLAKKLRADLEAHLKSVDAQLPRENPDFTGPQKP
jgi:arylsulfatase A